MTTPTSRRYESKDNEFIAWYPPALEPDDGTQVWRRRRAAFYVHIPFCTAICDYCGFAVERDRNADRISYLDGLHREIDRYAEAGRLAGYEFTCGHFGGGTPSVLPAADLLRIRDHLAEVADVRRGGELTVEVNPISFDEEHAEAYLEGGVNRLSIGIQSFDEQTLRTIGRPHRRADVERSLEISRRSGYTNVSLDLIYGVPGQTERSLRDDLARALDSGATHLSCFRLEIIPFTVLKLREAAGDLPPRLDQSELNRMDDLVSEVLREGGMREYGVFNFARPGAESLHNEIAFMAPQSDYVGFGNGAYSWAGGHIYTNHALIPSYLEAIDEGRDPIAFSRRATALEEMSRYFVLGLKFFRVPRQPFVDKFGLTPEDVFGPVLARLEDDGMVLRERDAEGAEHYQLTTTGRHYVNNVCKEFYVGDNRGRGQYVQFVPTLTPDRIDSWARRAGLDLPDPTMPDRTLPDPALGAEQVGS
ncbi:radical SAM family heme chaperone HemW [Actinopolymorpha sp. NPDC004070]|uniref:radical SAM family heme chaperone HemW n=1 Tax=Actinopolymorpha sp. NPDC004070 TaxID=3154548 RepID=UPI0033BD69DA